MAFWEYAAVMGIIDSKGSTRQYLDGMGAQGWELIGVTPTGYGIYDYKAFSRTNEQFGIYYFKRPAPPKGLVAVTIDKIRAALIWGRQLPHEPPSDKMPDLPEPAPAEGA